MKSIWVVVGADTNDRSCKWNVRAYDEIDDAFKHALNANKAIKGIYADISTEELGCVSWNIAFRDKTKNNMFDPKMPTFNNHTEHNIYYNFEEIKLYERSTGTGDSPSANGDRKSESRKRKAKKRVERTPF